MALKRTRSIGLNVLRSGGFIPPKAYKTRIASRTSVVFWNNSRKIILCFFEAMGKYNRKGKPMKSLVLVALFSLFTLAACFVSPGPPGYGGVVVSPLPPIVELGADPYYYQNGYYYFYQNNNWRYSTSRGGPWTSLPRSHWPKEIRHSDRYIERDRGRGDDRGRDYRQDHDRR